MLTTDYVSGSPCWIDLGAPDIDAAAAFYSGALGWTFLSLGPDAGGYGYFQVDGKTVAALGPLTEEGAISAWTLYFATPDADATAKAVEQSGGIVRVAAFDVFTAGRMAHFTDPAGAQFAVWQAGDVKGLDLVNDPGSLVWTEVYVPEPDAVKPFYQSVFGWTITDMPFGDMIYIMLGTDETEDSTFGGFMPTAPDDRPQWLPYFEVTDTDAVVAKTQELGGAVLVPAMDAEGVGRFSILADIHGARFAVIKSVPA